jgi:hypothetical protein
MFLVFIFDLTTYHGTEGPMKMENVNRPEKYYDVFSRAVKDVIGAVENPDYNGYGIGSVEFVD